jgi:hypothetical protein
MFINAGAAAARIESIVETHAVEQPVHNIARETATIIVPFMNRTLLINFSLVLIVSVELISGRYSLSRRFQASGAHSSIPECLQVGLNVHQLPLNALHRGRIAVTHSL